MNDETAALRLMKSVGYYRLSAYVYPFRELLPMDQRAVASPAHYRSESITAGTTFEQVDRLWRSPRTGSVRASGRAEPTKRQQVCGVRWFCRC